MDHIRPYNKDHGIWASSYRSYYKHAYCSFEYFQSVLEEIEDKEICIRRENPDSEEFDVQGLIIYECRDLYEKADMFAISIHLFACIAIEGFINHYGTLRLGEDLYGATIERLNIVEKIKAIILLFHNKDLPKKEPFLLKTRSLFEFRNRLVHSKTKKVNVKADPETGDTTWTGVEGLIHKHPRDFELDKTLEDIKFILECFCAFDPNVDKLWDVNGISIWER